MTQNQNLNVRVPEDLKAELVQAADDRGVSVNWLVRYACRDLLDRLIPIEDVRLTRPREGEHP